MFYDAWKTTVCDQNKMLFSYVIFIVQFFYCKHYYYSSANVDMSRICNHAMLQQTQPVDSHGGITICGMYSQW